MKGRVFIAIAIIINSLIALLIITPFVYVQANKLIYAHRVMNYLVHQADFKREEIQSVHGVWSFKAPPFLVVVVFKDDADVEYIYFAHSGVMQYGYRLTEHAINGGIKEANLKHYVPR
jgi:hypothetical protein